MADPSAAAIVKCINCGANNRVAAGSGGKQAVCGRCKNPLAPVSSKPLHITDTNFAELVETSPLPVLIDLWAEWCGPCRMLAPTIESLARELAGKVVVGKLNVDENPSTASRFGVQGIPTLLIIKNGREADRIVGVQSKEAILSRLKAHIS
jgi:thioredoxin 2